MAVGNVLLGTLRKKLGDIVFMRRAGEQVLRTRVRRIKNPQTRPQAMQRSRFGALLPIFRLLNGVLFGRLRIGWSQYNSFFSRNMRSPRPTRISFLNVPYEVDYPFLTPPTPRLGVGDGLSVPMPLIITNGALNAPRYGTTLSSLGLSDVGLGVNAINGLSDSSDRIMFGFECEGVLKKFQAAMIALGMGSLLEPETTSDISPLQLQRIISRIITGSEFNHIGMLFTWSRDGGMVLDEASYSEWGDLTTGGGTVYTDENGDVVGWTGIATNSRGETFVLSFSDALGLIGITLFNVAINAAVDTPTGASVITSRRRAGKLQVSTSSILLDLQYGVPAYASLFTEESIEQAVIDYTRQETAADGLNLNLND